MKLTDEDHAFLASMNIRWEESIEDLPHLFTVEFPDSVTSDSTCSTWTGSLSDLDSTDSTWTC